MRNLTFSLTIALALQGCAYQQAMKHGETAAAANEWSDAYDAYRFANSVKPGEAEQAAAEARKKAADSQLTQAESLVKKNDYATAEIHIDAAEHIDREHPRIAEVRAAADAAELAALNNRMKAVDDVPGTYAWVAESRLRHADVPEYEEAALALRTQIETQVREHLAAAEYAEARSTAEIMIATEPSQRARGQAIEQIVTDEWVGYLVAEAEAVQRDQPALAAVYWARAHEVGGDAAHLQSSAASLETAGTSAALLVHLDTKGSGGRHWRLRKRLKADAEKVVGVSPGRSSKWDLMAVVAANSESCAETKVKKAIEKEFVAGTKQVPNPAYAEVSEALDSAEESFDKVDSELDEAKSALATAQAEQKSLEDARVHKQRLVDEANKTLDATNEQIAASAERVKEVETEIAALDASNTTAVEQAQERLALIEGFHSDWKDKLKTDKAALSETKKALTALDAELDPQKAEAERLATTTKDADKRHGVAKKSVAELQVKKKKTDEELTENIMEMAKVDETTWTTTCKAPATVYYSTRWNTELAKKQVVEASNSSTDMSRPAHEGAKIEADEKAYPKSKDELVAELDTKVQGEVATALEAFVAESFNKKLAAALANTDDVGAATDTLLTVYSGARGRVDDATRKKIVEHLATHYGLEKAEWLEAPAPAEEPPPTEG